MILKLTKLSYNYNTNILIQYMDNNKEIKRIINSLHGEMSIVYKKINITINKIIKYYRILKQNKIIHNIFAFSLIELSIVLIIIGLLVAGITGGASLIESAKIQSVINELTTYKQAVYTFKSLKDRLPGDFVGSGFIGYLSGQGYNNNSFGTPYVSGNQDYGLPTSYAGPFVDLYLNKIIDFEPKKKTPSTAMLSELNGGCPYSKAFPDYVYYYEKGIYETDPNSPKYLMKEKTWLTFFQKNNPNIKNKIFQRLDQKLDDNIWNSGNFRSGCNYIYPNIVCGRFYYGIE